MSHRHEYEAVTGSDDRDSLPAVSSLSNGEMEDWVQSITQDEVSAELQGVRQPWKAILLHGPPGALKLKIKFSKVQVHLYESSLVMLPVISAI